MGGSLGQGTRVKIAFAFVLTIPFLFSVFLLKLDYTVISHVAREEISRQTHKFIYDFPVLITVG